MTTLDEAREASRSDRGLADPDLRQLRPFDGTNDLQGIKGRRIGHAPARA
jgi:hypothetical protein